jgi:threonylcarbamoyladenosine tRNA methylthiotransferase MtaB
VKRISFKTIGCRLNQAETAQMVGGLELAGHHMVPFGEPADVCVVHTCAVTSKADQDCVRIARVLKKSFPDMFVVLAGCGVEVDAQRLKKESGADLVLGQKEKFNLPALLSGAGGERKTPNDSSAQNLPSFETTRALIKVQDGCDFCCAYCIVPLARGKPKSRAAQEIVDEVKALADAGYLEVVLTGANLGCYKDGSHGLVDLIAKVEAVDGIARIRLSSIELSTVERDLVDYMAASRKLCHHIHLPLQSGDDRVLASMGRRYTVMQYREFVEYAIGKLPFLGIGTDILVGFPTEDESAFQNTVSVAQELPFSNLHVFAYSKRDGTRAGTIPHQVPQTEKHRRSRSLMKLGDEKKTAFAKKFIGKEVSVLVEKGRMTRGSGRGWTSEYVQASVSIPGLRANRIVTFIPSCWSRDTLR